nr:WHG domain-containing protein [Kineococcus vitellinus]
MDRRRDRITHLARTIAEAEGWAAVTVRRLAGELGVTQPVLYSAFSGRQGILDAVALDGFAALATALEAVDASPLPRMRAYLDFAAAHPRTYEAMFSLPSQLRFAEEDADQPLARAFGALREVFAPHPGGGGDEAGAAADLRAEVAWSTVHGLATLQSSGRLPRERTQARLEAAHRMLTRS